MADKGEYIPTGSELIEHRGRYYVSPDGLLDRMLENKGEEFGSSSLKQDDRLAACLAVLCRDCPPAVFREVAFPLPTRESMGVRH